MAGMLDGVDQRTQLAGQNRLELLLFRLNGSQRFGINVFKVREVIRAGTLTKVPQANPVVRGIANMRGMTIPIIDLSSAIGGPPLEPEEGSYVIIAEYNRSVQGFMVRNVDRIVNMHWETILHPPPGAGCGSYLTAVTHVDDELVEVIDVEKVLKEVIGTSETISDGLIHAGVAGEDQHILVADDSMVARHQIQKVLAQMGVAHTLVSDGREALQQLQKWRDQGKALTPWLAMVITDIEMPAVDGYALTTEMRKDPALKELYIMMHSSLSGVFNESMVRKVGADEFLPKYDADDLAQRIQRRLKEHGDLWASATKGG